MTTPTYILYGYTNLQFEGSYSVVCQFLVVSDSDEEGTHIHTTLLWPIRSALGLGHFHQVGHHHNSGGTLLPHHSPEGKYSPW